MKAGRVFPPAHTAERAADVRGHRPCQELLESVDHV